jgi:PAS domain S-box-containing protein
MKNRLNESNANLRSFMESAVDFGIYQMTVDNVETQGASVTFASPSLQEIMGMSDLYQFDTWFENIFEEDILHVTTANAYAIDHGTTYNEVMKIHHPKKKEYRWIHAISSPTFDLEGNPAYFNGLVIDITERKQVEEELRLRARFDDLITTISTKFINLSLEEVDGGINDALKAIGEFSSVDRSYVFVFNEDKTTQSNTHEWCREGPEPQIEFLQDIPTDNSQEWMEVLSRPDHIYIPSVADLPNDTGTSEKEVLQAQGIQSLIIVPMAVGKTLIGFVGFDSLHDETTWSDESIALLRMVGDIFAGALTRKQTEEALRRAYEETEKKVEERTAELANSNRELEKEIAARRQAEKHLIKQTFELQKVNEELSQYAYVVAHDVCAPLRAARLYSRHLRKKLAEVPDDIYGIQLDAIDTLVAECEDLAKDLLEFSRIGFDSTPEKIDMGFFLCQVVAPFENLSDVEITVADSWPTINTDHRLLKQVFQNLIDNAIKFNVSGHKRIKLNWARQEGGGYEFHIRDNGIGIADRDKSKIFDMFKRLHTPEEYTGTGMGLAIAFKSISKLGGSIRVESETGKGSTFIVVLPETAGRI